MSLVARIGHDEGYRVHALLRAHLVSDLQRQRPGLFAKLHDRAAHHRDETNHPVEALQHAFHAGDVDLVSELLHRHAHALVSGGERETIRLSMAALRAAAKVPDTSLELLAAISDLTAGDTAAAEAHLCAGGAAGAGVGPGRDGRTRHCPALARPVAAGVDGRGRRCTRASERRPRSVPRRPAGSRRRGVPRQGQPPC